MFADDNLYTSHQHTKGFFLFSFMLITPEYWSIWVRCVIFASLNGNINLLDQFATVISMEWWMFSWLKDYNIDTFYALLKSKMCWSIRYIAKSILNVFHFQNLPSKSSYTYMSMLILTAMKLPLHLIMNLIHFHKYVKIS